MLGVQFHNGRSSLNSAPKKSFDNSSKLYYDKSSRIENSKINPQQIQRTMEMQIKKANQLVNRINKQLEKETKSSQNILINDLRDLQEEIRRKNLVIKDLQNEVNILKNGNNKSKIKIQYLNTDIYEEIRCHTAAVIQLKKDLDENKILTTKKKKEIELVFQKYLTKCKNQGKQVIDFIKFKQMQNKKKKDFHKIDKVKTTSKKQMSSIWEQRKQEVISNFQKNQNRLKDTMKNKNVAEAALKTQKKRHRQQMNDFLSKLEFLKDEDILIQQKINKKNIQLEQAKKRFSQSRTIETKTRPERIQDRRLKGIKLKTEN